jgi:predicted PurR-regulated permease PerM
LEILIIVGIIYICTKISFLFNPIVVFLSTLFFPILITGFLYFIFNPIVSLLEKAKIPRTLAILLLYIVFIGLVVLVVALVIPILSQQFRELFASIPKYVNNLPEIINNISQSDAFHWVQNQDYIDLEDIQQNLMSYLSGIPTAFTNSLSGLLGAVANITLVVVTVPFLLFYLLKDGHKLPNAILKFLPQSYRKEGLVILQDTTNTLATYIQGQIIVSLCVGTLSFIGYLIIGLPYALLLGLAVAVTNIIPYLGPFLGAAPAFIVGLFMSPMTALLVVVVAVIAQQIESNFISPLVIGKALDTHPATIIIILLVAGNIAGILGMILGVPVYAVTKTIVLNIVRLVHLHRNHKEFNTESAEL